MCSEVSNFVLGASLGQWICAILQKVVEIMSSGTLHLDPFAFFFKS